MDQLPPLSTLISAINGTISEHKRFASGKVALDKLGHKCGQLDERRVHLPKDAPVHADITSFRDRLSLLATKFSEHNGFIGVTPLINELRELAIEAEELDGKIVLGIINSKKAST